MDKSRGSVPRGQLSRPTGHEELISPQVPPTSCRTLPWGISWRGAAWPRSRGSVSVFWEVDTWRLAKVPQSPVLLPGSREESIEVDLSGFGPWLREGFHGKFQSRNGLRGTRAKGSFAPEQCLLFSSDLFNFFLIRGLRSDYLNQTEVSIASCSPLARQPCECGSHTRL